VVSARETEPFDRLRANGGELVKGAPYTALPRLLDEATAARKPVLRWRAGGSRDTGT